MPKPPAPSSWFAVLIQDIKRLHKQVLKVGIVAGVVCHFLPPHYQVACRMVAKLCGGAGGH